MKKKKIITAQEIISLKLDKKKFDTNGFMTAVAEYFLDDKTDAGARLLLVPFRFLDIKWERFPGISSEISSNNPFGIEREDEDRGYKADMNMSHDRLFAMKHYNPEKYKEQEKAGILAPRIIIDEPFYENAAQALRVMGGYVLEKRRGGGRGLYWVRLI